MKTAGLLIFLLAAIAAIIACQATVLMYGWNMVIIDTIGVNAGKLSFWPALLLWLVIWMVGATFRNSSNRNA
jgi:hypothetical protein